MKTQTQKIAVILIAGALAVLAALWGLFAHGGAQPTQSESAAAQSTAEPAPTAAPMDDQARLLAAAAQNPDTVAWLTLPGTSIADPVVQGPDNDYYLRRDALGNSDKWGCYFGDYLNDFSARDALNTNTIIYGHAYADENPESPKFTQLFHYCDLEFVRQNPCFYLSLNGDDLTFQVAAVFFTDISFDYINPEPAGESLNEFFDTVARKNEYIFDGLDFAPGDKVLTLSTCAERYDTAKTGNQRLVVMGRLLPAGQEPQAVTVRKNPAPERP